MDHQQQQSAQQRDVENMEAGDAARSVAVLLVPLLDETISSDSSDLLGIVQSAGCYVWEKK